MKTDAARSSSRSSRVANAVSEPLTEIRFTGSVAINRRIEF
jgi:hypothetical protein